MDMHGLIQVLVFGFANLDPKFANKVNQFTTIDSKSLIKLKVDSTENVAHSLILSRYLNQPKVGTPACFISDVVKNEVASHGVWKAHQEDIPGGLATSAT